MNSSRREIRLQPQLGEIPVGHLVVHRAAADRLHVVAAVGAAEGKVTARCAGNEACSHAQTSGIDGSLRRRYGTRLGTPTVWQTEGVCSAVMCLPSGHDRRQPARCGSPRLHFVFIICCSIVGWVEARNPSSAAREYWLMGIAALDPSYAKSMCWRSMACVERENRQGRYVESRLSA